MIKEVLIFFNFKILTKVKEAVCANMQSEE
jgi:hypothetical protein